MTDQVDLKTQMIEELKKQGLDIAEETLVKVVEVLFTVGAGALLKSSNPILVALGGVLPVAKAPLLALIDKIDGEVG